MDSTNDHPPGPLPSTPGLDARPHVVVIGCGFGGLSAVRALHRAAVRILVVDRSNHHLFQPLLYQVATAALNPSDIAEPIRRILRHQENAEVILAEVESIDLAGKTRRPGRRRARRTTT